jgi:hypothetical protein
MKMRLDFDEMCHYNSSLIFIKDEAAIRDRKGAI